MRKEVGLLLKEFKKNLARKIKVDKLILFGSRAKGKSEKSSDIDLLIVSRDFRGKKYFKRSPEFYLMWDYPYDVDILCLTPEELEEKRNQIGVIQEALKEGKLIAG